MNDRLERLAEELDVAGALTIANCHGIEAIAERMEAGGTVYLINHVRLERIAARAVTVRNPWGGDNDGEFSMPFGDLGSIFKFTTVVLR